MAHTMLSSMTYLISVMAGKRGGRGPRPHTWVTGTDPLRHDMYHNWARARAQALFRSEIWDLSFEAWEQFWQWDWHLRGRGAQDICITRIDRQQPWHQDNICKITRRDLARVMKAPHHE